MITKPTNLSARRRAEGLKAQAKEWASRFPANQPISSPSGHPGQSHGQPSPDGDWGQLSGANDGEDYELL
jgi:hypothetical protein